MKKLFYLVLALGACTSDQDELQQEPAEEAGTVIYFQQGFFQDSVVLYRGSEKVYEQVLTTDTAKGYAAILTLPEDTVAAPLRFRFVNDSNVVEGTFPEDSRKYIGFYISSGTAVNIHSTNTPYRYPEQE